MSKSVLWSSRVLGFDEGEKIGIEKGRAEGIEQGCADAMREMARALKAMGKMTIDEIASAIGLTPDEISKI